MALSYGDDDVQQILQRAIRKQAHQGEFSRQQLVDIALELGISPTVLDQAEQEWRLELIQQDQRQIFTQKRRQALRQSVITYAIVCTFLVGLDWVTQRGLDWSPYVIILWGLGLTLKARRTLPTTGEHYEADFQRWQRSQQMKEFGKSVTQSVTTLLTQTLKPKGSA